jgi:ribonuclease III
VIPLRKADEPLAWVERSFGYRFSTPALCHAALTHRSAGSGHNERLEFLGDSVLNCCVARLLYDQHPQVDEGDLSRLRASMVSGATLAEISTELGVGDYVHLGAGELKSGGFRRSSILADVFEAMLGAIFLDSGFDAVMAAVVRVMGPRLMALPAASTLKDPKTRLQEKLQGRGLALPGYTLTSVSGEPHAQTFVVSCEVAPLGVRALAEAGSRRRAEQLAAAKVLKLLPAEMQDPP